MNVTTVDYLGPAPSFLTNVKPRRLNLWTGHNGMMWFIKEHSYFYKPVLLQKKSQFHTIEGFCGKSRSVPKKMFFQISERIVQFRKRACCQWQFFQLSQNMYMTFDKWAKVSLYVALRKQLSSQRKFYGSIFTLAIAYMCNTDKRTDGCSRPLCIYTQIPLKF